MAAGPGSRQLVVIGASAGGIDALSTLVGTLPTSFPAPIIVAQHLDPSRLSHLQEILARKSGVPVRTVHDQERLENGIVYVVPADRHVEIADHIVRVHAEPGRPRPAPSIDLLLSSAAEAFGERLVAVILTGLGSDGADGARRVKELGGTVVIQNPQTASHPDMPLSLAPTTVDIVADVETIGPLLNDLLFGTYTSVEPDDERRMRVLLDQVRARSGIDFSNYKEPTIRRRLQWRVLDTNTQTLEEYIRYLRRNPAEYDRLANSFLIKVTDFFRDADLFKHLREHVLPQLIREARERGNELRLWSAGCATGEEAYSLAILVSELLGSEAEQFTVRIFATDIDSDAVAFARRGVYPSSALKNVTPEVLERYMTPIDSAWEVRKHIRAMVIFGQHDLGQRAPFPRIDLVLCRNVLIYFTPELQRRALQLFAFALRDGGFLVLGKAESTSPMPEYFTLIQMRLKIFRRQGERVLIPPSRIRDAAPAPGAAPVQTLGRPALSGLERELARVHARQGGVPTPNERAEQVLLELPLGLVVVDRNYDILTINAAARRLLGIHSPAIGDDVTHLTYRELREPLRDAMDAAIAGEAWQSIHQLTSLPDTPGAPRYFELTSFVARGPKEGIEVPEAIVVVISDVTEREQRGREQHAALAEAQSGLETILASMSDAVMMVDANGEPVLTNRAFIVMFGEARPPLVGASGKCLPVRAHPARRAAHGETFTQPFTVPRADGSRRWYEASGQPVRVGGVAGGVVVIRDVTERSVRQLQEQFVALAGHELRTPLTALRGSLQLAQRILGGDVDERVGRYLRIGLEQTRLLDELVQDLADVIRVQTGDLPIARESVDLVELAQHAVELVAPMSEAQEIRLQADDGPVVVSGDRRRLQQVLLNLFANAVQHGASPRGVDVRVGHENSQATLEVIDYGAGIPPDERDHVFERFYRIPGGTAAQGLGVGLYLVQAIVSAHDGTVEVPDTNGQGATFVVRLPLAEHTA